MKNFIRDYFTFNKREKRGVILLLSVIGILFAWLLIAPSFRNKEIPDLSAFENEIACFDSLQKRSLSNFDSSGNDQKKYDENDYKLPVSLTNPKPERFEFDPNNLPDEDWKRMGFSDKQIRTIKNYENKGGKFRTKEDVKKMYCISAEMYSSLEPFIKIDEKKFAEQNKQTTGMKHDSVLKLDKPLYFELNSADSFQLDKLKGIGGSFAKRILKYRDILGGYVKKEQLLEVYGFDQPKYDLIKENIFVDSTLITKINVNSASFEQLKKHPYIKFNLAQLIVNYRNQHGKYKTLNDLRKLDLVTDEVFKKICPYLTVE